MTLARALPRSELKPLETRITAHRYIAAIEKGLVSDHAIIRAARTFKVTN
jgi:hypothetical protein